MGRVEGGDAWEEKHKGALSDGSALYLVCTVKVHEWLHLTKFIKHYILEMGVFYHINNISINLFLKMYSFQMIPSMM